VLLRAAVLLAAAAALAACGGKARTTTTTALPGCTGPQVQAIVGRFLTRPSVAPPPFFELYRVKDSDGRVFSTTSGPKAVAHARARLLLGERDRLLILRFATLDVNHARIVFQLTRSAPDFLRRGIHNRIANGTGTIDCAHGKIAAWLVNGP
jgi:hypothetical protein